ncbi:MAG: hypothetical protein PXY39_12650 [archaeon]|nr:hypothetical protein [archaeon]
MITLLSTVRHSPRVRVTVLFAFQLRISSLKSDADAGSEGSQLIGPWIANHPFADGLWWNVLNQGPRIILHGSTRAEISYMTIVSCGKILMGEELD